MGDARLRCSLVARISARSASATGWDHAVAPYEEPKLTRAARLGIAHIEHAELDRPEVDGPAVIVDLFEADTFRLTTSPRAAPACSR